MLDLAIHNGMVVDGTGSPGFRASVLVKDNRIAIHRGDHSGIEAALTIDAGGKVVCPGFVDLHSHAGLTMLGEPHHDPKVRQGVTTELVGIDGNIARALQVAGRAAEGNLARLRIQRVPAGVSRLAQRPRSVR